MLFYFFVNYLVIFYFILVALFFLIFLKGKKNVKKSHKKKSWSLSFENIYLMILLKNLSSCLYFLHKKKKHINITLNIHVVVFIRDNGIWIPIHVLNYENQTIFILPKRYYNNLIIIFGRSHLELYSTGLSSSNSKEMIGTLDL